MQPNNLTALDFQDIKASIKDYLRTRTEFSDYDFDGSSLSYLVDVLAYNSYYSSFMANMSMNEVFINSSTLRDNVVNIAKLLNYTPKSIKASYAYLHIDIQTIASGDFYPNNITLQSGAIAVGGNYTWNLLDPITVEVNQTTGIASFRCVKILEGSLVDFSYVVNTFAKQRYIIPNNGVDTETLRVSIRSNENSTQSDIYNLVENVTTITPTDRVYYLSETEDMRYEVTFGDGVIGRKLIDEEVIDLKYLVTSGPLANDIVTFNFIGTFADSNSRVYSGSDVSVTVASKSQFGDNEESIESIKFNAPRQYTYQYRAVTSQDYENITKNIYANAKTVVAYGGDEITPPIYGKVFIAIKTKTGSGLNDTTKSSISSQLRKYSMASIEPIIVDIDSLYVYPKVFVLYDPSSGSSTSNIKTNAQNSINEWAKTSGLNNFNGIFSLSSFQKSVKDSDRGISDVSTQLSLLKYIKPNAGQSNTYCISTGAPLYDSAPGKDGSDGCSKEPIVKSSKFRVFELPGVDQYFEDTGFGKLQTFYYSGNRKIITNTNAGTINYETGEICFGPVNIIGAGNKSLPVDDDDVVDASNEAITNLGEISIATSIIPENTNTIPSPTPGTIIEIITPELTLGPIGTTPPPNIPLNSLTPEIFEVVPPTLQIPDISNTGNLPTNSCF